jgi:hypothetical protein
VTHAYHHPLPRLSTIYDCCKGSVGPWYVIITSDLACMLIHQTGVPIAWMLLSNGTVATILFFLIWVKAASPGVQPSIIMTDHNLAQIKALKAVQPNSQCIWHVLHTIRAHFVLVQFQALWAKVRSLVRTKNSNKFDRIWTIIHCSHRVLFSI